MLAPLARIASAARVLTRPDDWPFVPGADASRSSRALQAGCAWGLSSMSFAGSVVQGACPMPSLGPPVSSPGGKRRDDTLGPLETAPGDRLPGLGVQQICSPETVRSVARSCSGAVTAHADQRPDILRFRTSPRPPSIRTEPLSLSSEAWRITLAANNSGIILSHSAEVEVLQVLQGFRTACGPSEPSSRSRPKVSRPRRRRRGSSRRGRRWER